MRLRFSAVDPARPEDPTKWPLYWCYPCSFGKLDGEFTPERVATFYPPNYYTHGSRSAPCELSLLDRARIHLAWRLDHGRNFGPSELPATSMSICDIGCGSGGFLRIFNDAGYAACGIEPDPTARRLALDFAPTYAGSAENLPPEINGKLFDVVLMSHVLEHCIDPTRAIRNARSLLSPKGTLVIEVPNNDCAGFDELGPAWPFTDAPRHLQFFTKRSLRLLLDMAGLKVTKTVYSGYLNQFCPEWSASTLRAWKASRPNETPPNFAARSWSYLARTAFAADHRKFVSLRIHGAVPR